MWQDAGYLFDKVRYGNRHCILLLTRIKKEFCSIIFQRIEGARTAGESCGTMWPWDGN